MPKKSSQQLKSKEKSLKNSLWGGRFKGRMSSIMEKFNSSIDFDKKLFTQDIEASKAHCAMLRRCGLISAVHAKSIRNGLDKIAQEHARGAFVFKPELEDVHMNIEARLHSLIGSVAGSLHMARSRNDQVATDMRLYVRTCFGTILSHITNLQQVLVSLAGDHSATVMPGLTHLQNAQPVSFGHHCLAYVEMLARDKARFESALSRVNVSPLGSAALAGTSFPIDRQATAKDLGFSEPSRNSLDAVSDRDFALEALSVSSICMVHLSRLAEEIVLWSSPFCGFITLSDAFSTGSSIMPQKRNPDAAELVRGKSGRVIGALVGLLTVMKALPLSYAKDMQEDKQGVFDALETLASCLEVMAGMVADMTVHPQAMKAKAGENFSTATDVADWLVRVHGIPFRSAHHITGALVALAEKKSCGLSDVPLEDMQKISRLFDARVFDVLLPIKSLQSRNSFGGTAPARVKKSVAWWQRKLKQTGAGKKSLPKQAVAKKAVKSKNNKKAKATRGTA